MAELSWRRSVCEGAGVNGAWELGGFQDAPEELRELRGLGAGCWRLETNTIIHGLLFCPKPPWPHTCIPARYPGLRGH